MKIILFQSCQGLKICRGKGSNPPFSPCYLLSRHIHPYFDSLQAVHGGYGPHGPQDGRPDAKGRGGMHSGDYERPQGQGRWHGEWGQRSKCYRVDMLRLRQKVQ